MGTLILDFFLMSLLCFLFYHVGYYFFKTKFFLSTFLGIVLTGALIAFFAAFAAGACKYIIGGVSLFLAGYTLVKFAEIKSRLWPVSQWKLIVFGGLLISQVVFVFYYYYKTTNGVFLFNGHDSYFFSIQYEIVKADYFSRLRIYDNYPMVWSKYHLLNGSVLSIPAIIAIQKTIFTYKLAKIIVITTGILGIFEYHISEKRNYLNFIFATLFLLVCTYNEIRWNYYTNGYMSILSLFVFLSLYNRKEVSHYTIIAVLGIFTFSLSRTTLPGFALMTLYALQNRKALISQIGFKNIFPLLITTLCGLSMVGTGVSPHSSVVAISYRNFFDADWTYLFPLSGVFSTLFPVGGNILQNGLYLLPTTALFMFIFIKLIAWANVTPKKTWILFLTAFVLFIAASYTISSAHLTELNAIRSALKLIRALFIFGLPLIIILKLAERDKRILIIALYLSLLLQIYIFHVEFSVPGFYVADMMMIYFIFVNLDKIFSTTDKIIFTGILFTTLLIFYSKFNLSKFILPVPDPTTHNLTVNKQAETAIKHQTKDGIFYYKRSSDDSLAAIATSIYGYRVAYSDSSSERFNISKRFVDKSQ